MKSAIAEKVFRQLATRGPLAPRQIHAIVTNYTGADNGDTNESAVAAAVALGTRVQWVDHGPGVSLVATVEQKLLGAVDSGPVALRNLSRAERLWWREHAERLKKTVVEHPPGVLQKPSNGSGVLTGPTLISAHPSEAATMIQEGRAFALGANWFVPLRVRRYSNCQTQRKRWRRVLRQGAATKGR